jgi:hypothetical protein
MSYRDVLEEPISAADRPAAMRQAVRLATVLLGALLLVGCAGTPVGALAGGPLLTVTARGGECPAATCETSIVVERDGAVHAAAKPPNALGTVPPNALAALDAAIRATDFDTLRSRPFTGECPTAYDGQELVFEFAAPGGVARIASCEVAIDYGSPLFVAVSTAVRPFIAIPTT